jgi:hypothetical protein
LVYPGIPAELAHILSGYVTKILLKKSFWSVRKLSAANRGYGHKTEDEGKLKIIVYERVDGKKEPLKKEPL